MGEIFTDAMGISIGGKSVRQIENTDGDIIWKKRHRNEPLSLRGFLEVRLRGNATMPVLFKSTDKVNWTLWDGSVIEGLEDEPCYIKGANQNGITHNSTDIVFFMLQGKMSGDLMSLIGEDIIDVPCDYCFYGLFGDWQGSSHWEYGFENFRLPDGKLKPSCCENMFLDIDDMARGKNILLPSTQLAEYCYGSLFVRFNFEDGFIPVLPAKTLATGCYGGMFSKSNITESPVLSARVTAPSCYSLMFADCANLIKVTCLATSQSERPFYYIDTADWLRNVPTSGQFIKAAEATFWEEGKSGIPTGWTVINQ